MKKWIAIVLLSFSVTGCKQGIGDRCQVNADCAEGFCQQAQKVCSTLGDAGSSDPIDAQTDAPTDAPIDASIDAMIDAT